METKLSPSGNYQMLDTEKRPIDNNNNKPPKQAKDGILIFVENYNAK